MNWNFFIGAAVSIGIVILGAIITHVRAFSRTVAVVEMLAKTLESLNSEVKFLGQSINGLTTEVKVLATKAEAIPEVKERISAVEAHFRKQ